MPTSTFPDPTRQPLPRLLIADDDPVVRSTLSIALDSRFDIVAAVADASDAVARAAETTPDAALVDVDMPGGGGPHAVQGIAKASPGTALIVLSGDECEAIVVDLLQAGAMSYCRKGVETHQLAETIERSIVAHRRLPAPCAVPAA
jgi:DNA-binding NarL/FixJ family response regulator